MSEKVTAAGQSSGVHLRGDAASGQAGPGPAASGHDTTPHGIVLSRTEAVYATLATIFVVVLVLTNIIGTKLFVFMADALPEGLLGFPIVLTAGIITYPITFLITDITSEVYGKKRADLLVVLGFVMSLLMLAVVKLSVGLDPARSWADSSRGLDSLGMQRAFEVVFSNPGILIFASMMAYLVAQLLDNRLFHGIRRLTGGKHLWLRNNGSTLISQLVDTIIVNTIFLHFALALEASVIMKIIAMNYLFKLVLALLDTPFVYLGVSLIQAYIAGDKTESGLFGGFASAA